ncbi:cytochrome P450 [Sphingobium sufflavum]|uniref:cytochrome P450 n=1 Tax=Sphingobium sufflavum TaxID=1129547 RepID=UPI001F15DAAF|nr:cytochrome P450 [Sphingobium sufflavum]MCE7796345.1 cytochrome P450 [Sphingobium sufflavum]
MTALVDRDYFSDHSILRDPYAYFEAVREKGPVYPLPGRDIVIATGFEESLEVLRNTEDFSSVIAPGGPAVPLPFEPVSDDLSAQIEEYRTAFVGGDLVVSLDGEAHGFSRSILSRLFTPSRLKANEQFISDFADRLARDAVAKGGCELIKEIATPFVTLVIADLLGVPIDDRQIFMDAIEAGPPPGSLDAEDAFSEHQPLVLMGLYFAQYVVDRRANPRDDVLSELSASTFPDGSTPDAMEIVRLATFLFGAGQDTSAKLLGNAMRFIVDRPDLQQVLRADPSQIPGFLEEVLRLEGSTKMTARLARRDTQVAGVPIPIGTKVMIALAAANRDPRRWEAPDEFRIGRPKIKEHLGFGRGAHVCIGAPLARVEVQAILEKLLAYTADIDLVGEEHGERSERRLDYEPSFIIRGLAKMHLKLTPAESFSPASDAQVDAKGGRGLFGFGRKKAGAVPAVPYATAQTKLGVLLADPVAKALLDKHFPGVSADKRIGLGKSMTLRAIQSFAADMFTDEALDALDAELTALGPRGGS